MRISGAPAAALALALVVAGCGGRETAPGSMRAQYLHDAAGRVAAADWGGAQTMEIAFGERSLAPRKRVFRAGRAYGLRLRNTDVAAHNFSAPGFFKAIAVQRVVSAAGESRARHWLSLDLAPGESRTLYFVAVRRGLYELNCGVAGHAARGETGTVEIVD